MKIIHCAAPLLAAAFFLSAPARAAESDVWSLSGEVGLVSDYRFRGVSQSNLGPAVQPSVTLEHKSGLYLNAWGSNIAKTEGGARAEIDFAAGYAWQSGPASIEVAVTYYLYPADKDLNYTEISTSAAFATGNFHPRIGLSYVPRQSATRNDLRGKQSNIYVSAGMDFKVPGSPITLRGDVGYENGFFDYAERGGKVDWRVGAAVGGDLVDFQLSYVASSERVGQAGRNLGGAGVVAQLSLAF